MAEAPARQSRTDTLLTWAFLGVMLAKIWLDRRSPGSLAAALAFYGMTGFFFAQFGHRTWTGYRRRRPHWTRESWRKYLRLSAMPILAIALLFTELCLLDLKGSRSVFGEPQSYLRGLWIVVSLAFMGFGAYGIATAVGWLSAGEPSEQFTRTRWFRRGHGSAIAD